MSTTTLRIFRLSVFNWYFLFFFHYVSVSHIFCQRFLWNGQSHCYEISSIDSLYWVAELKEISRSKVKGQGHNGRLKFKFWQSITSSIFEIETWKLHQNVHNHNFYNKKILLHHVILKKYCIILHNMKNQNFKQSYLMHYARFHLEIFTDVRSCQCPSIYIILSMSYECQSHEMKLTHFYMADNAFCR
jgi:hypothetical protein